MRAIWINPALKIIQEVTINPESELEDLQARVSGYIELAHRFDNQDVLFVNEEGLLHNPQHFFTIPGGHQPFAGNGIIVGTNPMKPEDSGDAKTDLEELKKSVQFYTIEEVRRRHA